MKTNKANQKGKSTKEKKRFSKFLKAPIRLLVMARDFYIRSMIACSPHVHQDMIFGYPTSQVAASTTPKGFSVGSAISSDRTEAEDYKKLLRAASTTNFGNKHETDLERIMEYRKSDPVRSARVQRSHSVGMERIDEDKFCEFGEELKVNSSTYPRSTSHAACRRTVAF